MRQANIQHNQNLLQNGGQSTAFEVVNNLLKVEYSRLPNIVSRGNYATSF